MGYVYILLTVVLSAYGQLVLKWRLNDLGALPAAPLDKLLFLLRTLLDPFVFSSFAAAFVASLAWMAALTKFELSYAYPFMSTTFVLVTLASYWLLREPLTATRVLGLVLIVAGVVVAAR